MEPVSNKRKRLAILREERDPKGPMMVWNGDRSEEDIQWMSNWAVQRKAELEKEKAQTASKTE